MADWHLTRQNIATKCASVTGINFASADDIDSALDEPAVLVTNTGSINILDRGPGFELRRTDIRGLLVLSRSELNGPAAERADDLLELLFAEFREGILLGQEGTVQDSWLDSADSELITVAGVEYVGYRLTWPVVVRENVTRSATA
jgi:hypothetical protein